MTRQVLLAYCFIYRIWGVVGESVVGGLSKDSLDLLHSSSQLYFSSLGSLKPFLLESCTGQRIRVPILAFPLNIKDQKI